MIDVDLRLDERRRGLLWFPLYDVTFAGTWTYQYTDPEARWLELAFTLPDQNVLCDNFVVTVDGEDLGPGGSTGPPRSPERLRRKKRIGAPHGTQALS